MNETPELLPSLDRLKPWLNARFLLRHPGGTLEVELIEAVALARHRPPEAEKFSLLFRGSVDRPLPQRIYRLEHPEAGGIDLFLVPVASTESGVRHYEAVINREVPPPVPSRSPTPEPLRA